MVNWEQRDIEILGRVKGAINETLMEELKPKRITISMIGIKLGIRSLLEKHLDKLPKTKKYLINYTEGIRDFQIRRIKWVIQEMQEEGIELHLWKIYRKAGIKTEYKKDLKNNILNLIKKQ